MSREEAISERHMVVHHQCSEMKDATASVSARGLAEASLLLEEMERLEGPTQGGLRPLWEARCRIERLRARMGRDV